MLGRLTVATSFVVMLAGCAISNDLGVPCQLVKRGGGDGGFITIKEEEIKPNKDFISFGSAECDDLVCVRDAQLAPPSGAQPTDNAVGYCSKACVVGSSIGCKPSNEAIKMSCRALILDETTLAAICEADPATCRQYFGETKSPYFCAQGTVPGT